MPQYTSSFRNNIRKERIADDTFIRTVTFNVASYGSISNTDFEANGNLFKRAYSDAVNRIYDPNVIIQLTVPAGDYYFRGTTDVNQYLILNPPQGGQIKIVGASRTGTRPTSTTLASQTKTQNYTSLANHYPTRFHFSYNGFYMKSAWGGATGGVGGFSNIAFFGTWNGSPGNQVASPSVDSRGLSGSARLEYCAFHGFNGPSANSVGILADTSFINAYSVIVSNCGRGIQASTGGSFVSYSANTDSDRDIITNIGEHGLIAFNNANIRLGTGAHIRNTGGYGAYAFTCSSITIEGVSISGNSLSSTYAYPGTSSYIDTSTGAP
jgi:hypothetical protein